MIYWKNIEDLKKIFSTIGTSLYNLDYKEKVKLINERFSVIKEQRKTILEYGNAYEHPYELLQIDSEVTGKRELIATCNVSRSTIHSHCEYQENQYWMKMEIK